MESIEESESNVGISGVSEQNADYYEGFKRILSAMYSDLYSSF